MTRVNLSAIRRLHIFVDTILVSIGWIGAYWLRFALNDTLGAQINPFDAYFRALPLIVGPWMISCWLFGIYRSTRMTTSVEEFQALFRGAALGLLVVASISFFFRELYFGRFVVVACVGLNFVLQGVSRIAFHKLEDRMRRSGEHDILVLIAGTGVSAIRLLQKLQDHPETGYRVVGFVDDSDDKERKDVANRPVLGHIDDLREIAMAQGVREVFVAMPSLSHTRMLSIVLDCEDLGMTFRVVTNLFEVLTASTPIDLVDDLPLVRLGRQRAHPFYEAIKRVVDVVGASIGLILLSPVMLWCARSIVRESSGPAIFRQERVGRDGKIFRIRKFRTMYADVEHYAIAPKDKSDSRITPFGRFLRITSLDELPQLFNVLGGEMSLVGPRPEMPFIVDTYDEWQRRRLSVKPGITGLWQILGRKDLPMHENLQYDFYYIRNRSLGHDLSILARTVGAVLARREPFEMGVDVSICIATYRRPKGLSRLFDSLERLKIPLGIRIETVVVDNDCDASAASIVKSRSESLQPIHYCVEPRRNIALARNRALSESSGRWVLFIDDDEVADENWISEHLMLVESEPCDGTFGPVLPRLEEVVTPWLDIQTFYARSRHETGEALGAGDLSTSNALVRRRLFDERSFDPAYGLTGGSDSEIFGRMLRSGARFLWCDEALVVEFVPPERHRLGWLAQRAFRGGCVHTRLARSNASGDSPKGALRAMVLFFGFAVLAPIAALRGRRPLARAVLRACTQAGHLWALMGRSYEEYGAGFSTNR